MQLLSLVACHPNKRNSQKLVKEIIPALKLVDWRRSERCPNDHGREHRWVSVARKGAGCHQRLRDCAILILETFTPGLEDFAIAEPLSCCQHVLQEYLVTILPFVFSLYNVFSTYMFFPETPATVFQCDLHRSSCSVFSYLMKIFQVFILCVTQSCTDLGQLVVSFRPEFSGVKLLELELTMLLS